MAIRTRLYNKLGAHRARQMLAANFPGGSARGEIKRRIITLAEKGETKSAALSQVIDDIVAELISASQAVLDKAPPMVDPREELKEMKEKIGEELVEENAKLLEAQNAKNAQEEAAEE